MGFHYSDIANAGLPLAYAPLGSPVSEFPVTVGFTLSPHADKRVEFEAGLMSSAADFNPPGQNDVAGLTPAEGLAVYLHRSGFGYENSQVAIVSYGPDQSRTVLVTQLLSFQFEPGLDYRVLFTVNGDATTTLQVFDGQAGADGLLNDTVTSPPMAIGVLDQVFFSDVGGGVGNPEGTRQNLTTRIDGVFVSPGIFANLLTLTKVGPDVGEVGEPMTYDLAVLNASTTDASAVTVTDTLPSSVTFSSASSSQGTCHEAAGIVTCQLGDLGAGANATMLITVTPTRSDSLVNTATVSADQPDLVTADNSAEVRTAVEIADLAIIKSASDAVSAGGPLTYTLTATNAGPTDATSVLVTDDLPDNVTFGSATASQGTCAALQGTVSCELGALVSRSSAVVSIEVAAPPTGVVITNTATVTADQGDPNLDNNLAVVETQVSDIGCGEVLLASTTLDEDIGPCAGDGVVIGADNIMLDLAGHRIFGFPGPGNGSQAGIRLPFRTKVRIIR